MAEPVDFRVWSEHHDEAADAGIVTAYTARGATLMAIASLDDEGELLLPVTMESEDECDEDWFARGPDGRVERFRLSLEGRDAIGVLRLRACRVCGCCDDQACEPACAWVEGDLCSSCAPAKEVA